MGIGSQTDWEFGPHHRTGVGWVWGVSWSRKAGNGLATAHEPLDTIKDNCLDIIDAATAAQTLSGWLATMTQAESDWFTQWSVALQNEALVAAKAYRVAALY